MSAKDCYNVKKKYELVAPDGGWGYMIAIAVIINISTSTAFTASYGLLYKEFLQEIGKSPTNATLMNGFSAICTAIAGFLTRPLLSIMSVRMLMLAATLIFNTGVICIMFVKSAFTFHLCHGMLQGLGFGFIYNLSCTILNDYFVKRRLMAISLVQSAVAVILMVAPLFVKWSLIEYGFRDTILIMSGLTAHNFIAVALMQPVKWHRKRIEVPDGSNEKLFRDKKLNEEAGVVVPIIKLTNADGNLSNPNEKLYLTSEDGESGGIKIVLAFSHHALPYLLSYQVFMLHMLAKESSGLLYQIEGEYMLAFYQILGSSDLYPVDGNIAIRKIINALVDKSLCDEFLMSCVCAGPALAMFADTTYSSILPQALYTAGWLQDNIALAQSLYGFGDLAMRVLFIVLSNWLHKLGSQEIYVLGVTLGLVSRLGMLWSKSFLAMMVYIPLVGASHCAVTILIPLVVADAVAPHKFTAALGMLMMLSGLVSLVVGPAIGAVRELSESYGPVFYLIASCFAIIVLFWSIELCYKRNKHKRLQRREYLRQKKLNK